MHRNWTLIFRSEIGKSHHYPIKKSSRRQDVTVAWNKPLAASCLGENLPRDHLMYLCSFGTFSLRNEAAKGSFQATVTSRLLELFLWGSDVIWESLTWKSKSIFLNLMLLRDWILIFSWEIPKSHHYPINTVQEGAMSRWPWINLWRSRFWVKICHENIWCMFFWHIFTQKWGCQRFIPGHCDILPSWTVFMG